MDERCDKCYYWQKEWIEMPKPSGPGEGVYDGTCRRYPKFQPKDSNDWCGEFLENKGMKHDTT